jgi:hypothetical protein
VGYKNTNEKYSKSLKPAKPIISIIQSYIDTTVRNGVGTKKYHI